MDRALYTSEVDISKKPLNPLFPPIPSNGQKNQTPLFEISLEKFLKINI